MKDTGNEEMSRLLNLLLEIGAALYASGAHCGRISRNIERVAEHWGCRVEPFLSFTGMTLSLEKEGAPETRIERSRRCTPPGVHFGVVTEISLLSWRVREMNLSIEATEAALSRILEIPPHPRGAVLFATGLACGSLCLLAGGDGKDGAIAFLAAAAGLSVKQAVIHLRFHPMIAVIAASFVTTAIAGLDVFFQIGSSPESALATSALYLIPGVPLINSMIDLIDGNIPVAIARGVSGGFTLLCIAVGMFPGILLFGIHHF
jgi:uncharacterized membrane protein YjjP (DUF1212 family)